LPCWWRGGACDQAFRLTHEAEARISALRSDTDRQELLERMLFDARTVLDPKDPLLGLNPDTQQADRAPAKTAAMVRRYRSAWDDRYQRATSYRNRLIFLTVMVTVFVCELSNCLALFFRSVWHYWGPTTRVCLAALTTSG
jgi:hypothetical protein